HPEIGSYAAYPKIDDPSLFEWVRNRPGDLEFRRVAAQIAEFVSFLHHRGFLYNDFKPEHFLIGKQEISVIDLGLCAAVSEGAKVFSGTFPYISPERLMGRRYDQRSDIFALGILLLQCFYSEEDWNVDPSLPALQQLIAKCSNLNDFWAKLIAQMTALEPSQRCESADEVWRRLLPMSASRNFLYFPPPAYRTVGTEMFDGACRTLLVKSPSSIELSRYESSVLSIAWEQNWTTCRFDFRSRSLEDYLGALHRVMLEESPTDFYSCVQN